MVFVVVGVFPVFWGCFCAFGACFFFLLLLVGVFCAFGVFFFCVFRALARFFPLEAYRPTTPKLGIPTRWFCAVCMRRATCHTPEEEEKELAFKNETPLLLLY